MSLKTIVKSRSKVKDPTDHELRKKRNLTRKELLTGERWAKEQKHSICKSCKGQCCYLSTVILDREAADRRLHEFAGDYEYAHSHTAPVLRDLGRKNQQAPVLKKKEDGSCIYFDRDKRSCTIYQRRPHACRSFFCGRGTTNDLAWRSVRSMEKIASKQKKHKEAKLESMKKASRVGTSARTAEEKYDRDLPLLDALLAGEKLWNSGAPALVQKAEMKKVSKLLHAEHQYMMVWEPQDKFHACVLLGALNLVNGLLCRKKPMNHGS